MDKNRKNIIVIEPSDIVYEGIATLLRKAELDYSLFRLYNLEEIKIIEKKKKISIVIINPLLIQNRLNDFQRLKKQFPIVFWIGLVYSYHDESILEKLDSIYALTDDISKIVKTINNIHDNEIQSEYASEELTEQATLILQSHVQLILH
jgi:hypothetical protein